MGEPKTACTSCGCEILQRTADRNGGLCAPCTRKPAAPAEEIKTPIPPVTPAMLDELIALRGRDAVIDALFEPACDKVNFRPWDMGEGDIIVYTIWTFLGETCNGGFIQYLTNQSGGWAHCCGSSLRRIGAAKYADIFEECVHAFTDAKSPQDPKWKTDLFAHWDKNDEPFEEIEQLFWQLYFADEDELPTLLFNYICDNRDIFAAFDG